VVVVVVHRKGRNDETRPWPMMMMMREREKA